MQGYHSYHRDPRPQPEPGAYSFLLIGLGGLLFGIVGVWWLIR